MPKINRLITFLVFAALVLMGLPDTALGQLTYNPTQFVSLSIGGPGQATSTSVTIGSTTTTITSVTIGTISTSLGSGNWLCATGSSSSGVVSIAVGTSCPTTQLAANQTYSGTVTFTTNAGSGQLNVTLSVQGATGTGNLVANPSPLNFNFASGSTSPGSSSVAITSNGNAVSISGVTTSGQSWLQAFAAGSSVTVTANPTGLSGASIGTVNVTTPNGQISFTVNMTIGSTGLIASPSPIAFNLTPGTFQSVPVSITLGGSPTTVNSVTAITNSGQAWLQAALAGSTGAITVSANAASFTGTSDSGTVTVNTPSGSTQFTVSLTTSGSSSTNFAVSPSPVSFTVPAGSANTSQNVTVTYAGVPVVISSLSTATGTGQAWLQAFAGGATGVISVQVSPSIVTAGTYTGSVSASTGSGLFTFPVTLSVGSGSAAGLAVDKPTLTFSLPIVGSGTTPQTVNVTYNGTPIGIINVTSSTAAGQNWLLLSTGVAVGSVSVGINGANLTVGTYSSTVTAHTTAGDVNFQVNLTVGSSSSSGLTATPNPVFLNAPVGSASASQNITVTNNNAPASINSVSTATNTGQGWLQATNAGTAGTVTVTANPALLTAGTYTGTVTLNTSAGTINVTVNLTVGTAASGLSANPNPVTLSAVSGGTAASQNVSITLNGSPVAITSVSATTTTGQNWLLPTTSSTTGNVVVSVNPSILAVGSYTGTVNAVTASGTATFQVNLTVGGASTSGLVATPNPVAFTESAAGEGGSQTLTVTQNGAPIPVTNVTFQATPLLAPTFINSQVNPDGTVTLTVNSVITSPGFYQGTATLYTVPGSVSVPVTLTFSTGGGTGGLVASPSTANFNIQVGGVGAPQNIALTFNGAPATITSVGATTTTGQTWLVPSISSTVGTVTIAVNSTGLLAGIYSGTVSATTTSGTMTIPVNLTVGSTSGPAATITPSSLSAVSFQVGGVSPQPQTIAVALVGGGTTNFTATAATTTGGQWLSVSPASGNTPGNVTVTVNPANLAAGTYQGTVTIAIPIASNSPLSLPISLTVTPAPAVNTPTVVAVQNAASTLPTAISPGLNILIFGSNLGPATVALFQIGASGTVATTVSGTRVTFDGVPAPIILTSSNKLSVMVPYEIQGQSSTAMVVTYNGVASQPVSLPVAPAAPGIYTLNTSGSGQGTIFNQDGTVNVASNPEAEGNIIQIFVTGEGTITPAGVNGAITPARLPLPTVNLPVAVSIGGIDVPAEDITATEAPGLISGVMVVSARIPVGVGEGPKPIVVRVGGAPSQSNVIVSVKQAQTATQ